MAKVTLLPPAQSSADEIRAALADVGTLIEHLSPTAGMFIVLYDNSEPTLVAVANMAVPDLIAAAFAVATQQVPVLMGDRDDDDE